MPTGPHSGFSLAVTPDDRACARQSLPSAGRGVTELSSVNSDTIIAASFLFFGLISHRLCHAGHAELFEPIDDLSN
jgi:hypothetical protein